MLVAVAVVQVFIVSAGFKCWPTYGDDYSQLAQAFLHGQTSLLLQPPPALLALPDPYDPVANRYVRKHDAILFNGKYYLYWGPAPALLIAAVCWPLRISNPRFGDQSMVLAFALGTVACAMFLIFQIRSRYFPQQPKTTASLAVLSLGLGTPMLFLLARAATYEEAIVAGQFFLLAGICAIWIGIAANAPRPLFLAAAGFFWAMAAGSRISLAPALAAMSLLTLWQVRRSPRAIAALVCPLAIGAGMFAWYNFARFGSVFEFGLRYQLATSSQHVASGSAIMSWGNLFPDLLTYLLAAPQRINAFPYLWVHGVSTPLGSLLGIPRPNHNEAIVGLIWSQPFLIFSLFAARGKRASSSDTKGAWLFWMLTCAVILAALPVLMVIGATMRYLMDITPCLTVLAAWGYWGLLERLAPGSRGRRELVAAARLAVAWQCVIGLLLAWTGYYGHFQNFNPALHAALRNFLPAIHF